MPTSWFHHPSIHEFINSTGTAFKVRATVHNGKEWFMLADVCAVLGLSNPTMAARPLGEADKGKINLALGTREDGTPYLRGSDPTCITESGLYKLIMRSRKTDAIPFQDWVTKTVLPTLRKEGVYVQGEEKIEAATSDLKLRLLISNQIRAASILGPKN